jgi:SAM-dependent methyltransferase
VNLVELMPKSARVGQLSTAGTPVSPAFLKRRIGAIEYRGLDWSASLRLALNRPFAAAPWSDLTGETGWLFWLPAASGGATLEWRLSTASGSRVERAPLLAGSLNPVLCPVPVGFDADPGEVDVELTVSGDCAGAFLAVHRVLGRQPLIELCRGTGVEVGPGPNPQVRPGAGVDVIYIEQKTRDEWFDLYRSRAPDLDASVWDRYRVGEAHALPVDDGSCDFVFSSHVLEHLPNPLGHLAHWLAKLRSGGRIVAVVPDLAATRDHVVPPSTAAEWLREFELGQLTPTLEHYRKNAPKYGPGFDPQAALERGVSVHMHFYRPATMAALLRDAAARLPIAGWTVRSAPNHKDFHIVVTRR